MCGRGGVQMRFYLGNLESNVGRTKCHVEVVTPPPLCYSAIRQHNSPINDECQTVSKGFDTAVKTGSSRRFKQYPTTYK